MEKQKRKRRVVKRRVVKKDTPAPTAPGYKVSDIAERYKGKYIKIGAKSGFFFCGIVDDTFPDKLREFDTLFPKIAEKDLKVAEAKIRKIKATIEELELKRDTRGLKDEELKRLTESLPKQLASVKATRDGHILYLKEFTPLEDREVLDEYNSICFEEFTDKIIIIDGKESGQYWLRSEAETGIIERDI